MRVIDKLPKSRSTGTVYIRGTNSLLLHIDLLGIPIFWLAILPTDIAEVSTLAAAAFD